VNPIIKTTIALTLALLFAIPASAQSFVHPASHMSEATAVVSPIGSESTVERGQGLGQNPPSTVREPGRRSRLIVAITFVGALAGFALWLRAR